MIETRGLGRRPAPDERDRGYPMRAALPREMPPNTRYWRGGQILNQGPYPHCVGYAWRQWMNSAPIMTRQQSGPDAVRIYGEAQKVDEWPGEGYDGTSVRAGVKVLQSLGHVEQYLWAWDMPTIRDFVLLRGPVVLGTVWTSQMFTPDRAGFLWAFGDEVGGHAYMAIGYSSERKAFRCVNSWGRGWGQSGRFWLHEGEMAKLMERWGEACAAVERKVV